jgi:hypothetical protein
VEHSLALKRDGTVVAWGYISDGDTNVLATLSNVTAIAAGASGFSLALVDAPSVTSNPSDQTVNDEQAATFSAAALPTSSQVQWQAQAPGGAWTDVPGATSSTLSFTAALSQSGRVYRAAFILPGGTAYTTAAMLTVLPPTTGGGNVRGAGGGPNPSATPELESLVLFSSGASGLAGYALLRVRARRRSRT